MIFVIVGPTGVGKSSLALQYALDNDAVIINGDVFQCYKEMHIGTAKPSIKERSLVPHYLFDIASVNNPYTIFDYQRDLRKTIDELLPLNKNIVIVGGSGLYLKSSLYDFTLNEQKESIDMSKYDEYSNEDLYEELKKIDYESAQSIHPNNRKRVLRAIEIYLESGKKKSDIIASQEHKLLYDVKFIGLTKDTREELYKLIDERVLKMFDDGLLDEVKNLVDNYDSGSRAFQAIGYKEIIDGLKEDKPLDEMIKLIQKNTRNYAKRQYTYFNNQLPVSWFNSKEEAYKYMKENGGYCMDLLQINKISDKLGIPEKFVEPYGKYKAKISLDFLNDNKRKKNGKLVLVTAITPTKAGEGKTTTTVALLDGLNLIGVKAVAALREPSLGPVFGLKGGATGGGKVTIEPTDDINLHFTGDFHALTSSINLISAVLDNHIYQGNELNIDPEKIVWNRAIDMNDRTLREIVIGCGAKTNGIERKDGFIITVASELMAVFCLASSSNDFIERVSKIIVAYTYDDKPVTVKDLKITNAISKLMKEALKPNLVQSQEHNPAFVHGGPFANIAHGCNSVLATKMALKCADVVVTEAGFGADLGAEKFLDIKCQEAKLKPDLVVMVATIRALKMHGGQALEELEKPNVAALKKGMANLERHLSNIKKFGLKVVVAINHFASDAQEEIDYLTGWCERHRFECAFLDGFLNGGKGSEDLARLVKAKLEKGNSKYHPIYTKNQPIKEKILRICQDIYRADDVEFSEEAEKQIEKFEKMGFVDTYICMAKTPNSFSDDPSILNAPRGFNIHVKEVRLSAGANFLVCLTGAILTLPGLPKIPQAVKMEDK